jgi:hypothetical protein|tara:strand:- start:393 stop:518 length:126 start_codon:yes stop_codon:yes gene_type:complete
MLECVIVATLADLALTLRNSLASGFAGLVLPLREIAQEIQR